MSTWSVPPPRCVDSVRMQGGISPDMAAGHNLGQREASRTHPLACRVPQTRMLAYSLNDTLRQYDSGATQIGVMLEPHSVSLS